MADPIESKYIPGERVPGNSANGPDVAALDALGYPPVVTAAQILAAQGEELDAQKRNGFFRVAPERKKDIRVYGFEHSTGYVQVLNTSHSRSLWKLGNRYVEIYARPDVDDPERLAKKLRRETNKKWRELQADVESRWLDVLAE